MWLVVHKRVQPLANKGSSIVDEEEKEAGVWWWAEKEEDEDPGVWWCPIASKYSWQRNINKIGGGEEDIAVGGGTVAGIVAGGNTNAYVATAGVAVLELWLLEVMLMVFC
mmetsp:Transcript_29655/g.54426  ORF Transcript_29655/g.54426 Transcript_29655/m.54426 type:complete len:110 (+) Transcript_29655:716-1045(+)